MTTSLPKARNTGVRWDHELRQGATWGPFKHTLRNPSTTFGVPGTLVDLTDCILRGQVRRKALDATVVATFNITYASPRTLGWYTFGLTDEQTAAITCGDKLTDAASLYEYDVELEDAAGNVMCLLYGDIRVKAEVTRP
jgi:hypothetical protein